MVTGTATAPYCCTLALLALLALLASVCCGVLASDHLTMTTSTALSAAIGGDPPHALDASPSRVRRAIIHHRRRHHGDDLPPGPVAPPPGGGDDEADARLAGTPGPAAGAAASASARAERSANLSHIAGAGRKIMMYVRNRHLQILPDGTVNGTDNEGSDYALQPCSPAALQPCSPAALQPCSPAALALQPCSPAASGGCKTSRVRAAAARDRGTGGCCVLRSQQCRAMQGHAGPRRAGRRQIARQSGAAQHDQHGIPDLA
ncbi:hypothetical protein ONE63_000216 [Megalurothrips usitatus]|uniref:Uncharacterized protein n=1 Tax=Megalurothrips usitatus TaxID=439358 RepID=A0AAV7Y177_9NEOP|nr:hypothetical protein ONE63_000216 [Megalurothrips usitatus]